MAEWLCSGLQIRERRFDSDLSLHFMKILITGCAGFIGFHLAQKLLKNSHEVFGIDNLNEYYGESLKDNRLRILKQNKNFYFKKVNLYNKSLLRDYFLETKPSLVINLAAQAGVRYSRKNPLAYMESNVYGFINLIECMKEFGVKKLIYASSSSVYGDSKEIPFAEDAQKESPVSLYGSTKLLNEELASNYSNNYDFISVGLRFFTVYGPYGRPDMAYYSFTRDIINNKEIIVFNRGKMSRDMTYISDIVDGIMSSIIYIDKTKVKHQIFNLGNETPIFLEKLIEKIEKKLNKKAKIIHKSSEDEVENTYADLKKAKSVLGYSPSISFEEGMNNFFNWHDSYYEK